MSINFFIGYDPKEDIAYRICKYSLLKRASTTEKVYSLKLDELIAKKLYSNKHTVIKIVPFEENIKDERIIINQYIITPLFNIV